MRRLREAEKMLDEPDNENGETVYETRNGNITKFPHEIWSSISKPPEGKMLGNSRAFPAGGQGGNKLPPPPPQPAGQHGHNDKLQCFKKDSYVDFFRRALRNLGGDTPANREWASFIANQELELQKARAKK
jgi:hypothetical protein